MSSNESRNVFDGIYYSGKDTIDQIKQAYSSPRECVHSYCEWVHGIHLDKATVLLIYYFLMNIIRSCCCCCYLCRPSTYTRSRPTVLVQPAVVSQYPVWYPERMDPYQKKDMYYDPFPEHAVKSLPQNSPWKRTELENNRQVLLAYNKEIPRSHHYITNDFESKKDSGNFWSNYHEDISKENVLVDSGEYLSGVSVNSNYSYVNSNQEVSDEDSRSIRYLSNSRSYTDTLDSVENRSYFLDTYNKNRAYSGI
ncbi:hypothetical protein MERGE_000935 [Pneumocystis wakefieldiae]|uniref:Uncharacterized protein n=1 Tax=Pneumocystis wakefieldiae TaxID=38082 RepID=A0A899G1R8_9ASCO|nr:hypothetical protein MERGE_000935 [Pneumocystis wakefieldiae]